MRHPPEIRRHEIGLVTADELPDPPGDVITTGTPAGVGMGMRPPVFLKLGDVMCLEGGPLGRQYQRVP